MECLDKFEYCTSLNIIQSHKWYFVIQLMKKKQFNFSVVAICYTGDKIISDIYVLPVLIFEY